NVIGVFCVMTEINTFLETITLEKDEPSMPEPGDAPRRSPQGVPYTELRHIVNADGLHLFCRYWEPTGPPRALVFIAHGAGEHSGPYEEIAQRLKELSLLVFAHDH
ncbi:hypothetical protein XENORESO_004742, partial [Xenotaenia resolanae]